MDLPDPYTDTVLDEFVVLALRWRVCARDLSASLGEPPSFSGC